MQWSDSYAYTTTENSVHNMFTYNIYLEKAFAWILERNLKFLSIFLRKSVMRCRSSFALECLAFVDLILWLFVGLYCNQTLYKLSKHSFPKKRHNPTYTSIAMRTVIRTLCKHFSTCYKITSLQL